MTYKYQYIRRALYEENPSSNLNSYRSLAEMARLFKRPYWIMLGKLAVSVIAAITILIIKPTLWVLIPSIIIVIVSVLSQIPREKHLYHSSAREMELSDLMNNYQAYVSNVLSLLEKYGIDTPDKVSMLRKECEDILQERENKYSKIYSRVTDMLIGVPLGALIASIIYTNSETVSAATVILIIVGLVALVGVKLIRFINFYSEGYFKDKYLLDAIYEISYSDKVGLSNADRSSRVN